MFFFILEETLSHGLFKLLPLIFTTLLPLIFTILLSVLFIVSGLFALLELNKSYISNEWAITSPPKPHSFVSSPLQSSLDEVCLSVYNKMLRLNPKYKTVCSRLKCFMEMGDVTLFQNFTSTDTFKNYPGDKRVCIYFPNPKYNWLYGRVKKRYDAAGRIELVIMKKFHYMDSKLKLVKDPQLKAKCIGQFSYYNKLSFAHWKFLESRIIKR